MRGQRAQGKAYIKKRVFGLRSKHWHSHTDRERVRPSRRGMPKRPTALWRGICRCPPPSVHAVTPLLRLAVSIGLSTPFSLEDILSHVPSAPSYLFEPKHGATPCIFFTTQMWSRAIPLKYAFFLLITCLPFPLTRFYYTAVALRLIYTPPP